MVYDLGMPNIPISDLEVDGSNAPITTLNSVENFSLPLDSGATGMTYEVAGLGSLRGLLVNKKADVLVVSLHGAVDREKVRLPRFERLRSINNFPVSGLYFSDPSLVKADDLLLSWFVGDLKNDVHEMLAKIIKRVAELIGCKHIIISGSSGGGFASLQISSLIPGSLALAFNAQTDITKYLINGTSWGAQRKFVEVLFPEEYAKFTSLKDVESGEWAIPLGDRVSACKRYAVPKGNFVHIVQNVDEFHYSDHYLPFVQSITDSSSNFRLSTSLYHGGEMHNPPPQEIFESELRRVIKLLPWLAAREGLIDEE